jgi:hypothetical protein
MNITLASGNTISANAGIIGIDGAGNLFGGYDSEIFLCGGEPSISPADRIQIARMMIRRWEGVLERAEAVGTTPEELREENWKAERQIPIRLPATVDDLNGLF